MIDSATLNTLPTREVHAGMAEVIKYGVIGDPVLFEALEAHGRSTASRPSGNADATDPAPFRSG